MNNNKNEFDDDFQFIKNKLERIDNDIKMPASLSAESLMQKLEKQPLQEKSNNVVQFPYKKLLPMAACFAFVLLIALGYDRLSTPNVTKSPEQMAADAVVESSMDEPQMAAMPEACEEEPVCEEPAEGSAMPMAAPAPLMEEKSAPLPDTDSTISTRQGSVPQENNSDSKLKNFTSYEEIAVVIDEIKAEDKESNKKENSVYRSRVKKNDNQKSSNNAKTESSIAKTESPANYKISNDSKPEAENKISVDSNEGTVTVMSEDGATSKIRMMRSIQVAEVENIAENVYVMGNTETGTALMEIYDIDSSEAPKYVGSYQQSGSVLGSFSFDNRVYMVSTMNIENCKDVPYTLTEDIGEKGKSDIISIPPENIYYTEDGVSPEYTVITLLDETNNEISTQQIALMSDAVKIVKGDEVLFATVENADDAVFTVKIGDNGELIVKE